MKRRILIMGCQLVVACVIAAALGGCSLWHHDNPCASKEEYQTAQTVPLISVPEGLNRLDPATRLNVPDEPKPAEPLSGNAACLQQPPNYFDKPIKGSGN